MRQLSLSNGKLKQHKLAVEAVRTKLGVNIMKNKERSKVIDVDMMIGLHFSERDDTSYSFSLHEIMDCSHFLFRDDFQLEWIHSRNEVPDFLECHGVPLQIWQKWFDRMDNLSIERRANFNPKYLTPFNFLFLSITRLFDCYIVFTLFLGVVLGNWNSSSVYSITSMFSFGICMAFYSAAISLSLILLYVIKPAIHKRSDETENAWSELISAIQAEAYNQYGLNVEAVKCTMHRYISYTGTVGLHFSFISGRNVMDFDIENTGCNRNVDLVDSTWCDDERALV